MSAIALDTLAARIVEEARLTDAPKHVCVLEAFTKCIRSGAFAPGARVPTEIELSRSLPVSLGTLQKALAKLAERGLLVRNRKTGTYVADRRSQAPEVHIYRYRDPATGEYLLPFTRVLDVVVDTSDGPWRDAQARRRRKFVRIDRMVWVEGDPPAFNSVYVAYAYASHVLRQPLNELDGSSFHRILTDRFNLPSLGMSHKIRCCTLGNAACDHLGLARGTIGSQWDVTTYSFDDEAILFQRFELPPGHREIEIAEPSAGS